MRSGAPAAWDDGRVLVVRDNCPGRGVLTLVVPTETLTTEVIFAAVERWVASGMPRPATRQRD